MQDQNQQEPKNRSKAQANEELSGALSRLLVVVERYPDLKSSQNFKDLSVAIEGTENRIAIARQDYNESVNNYNTGIRKFPNSIIAGMFRFSEKPYFKAEAGAGKAPKVDFSKQVKNVENFFEKYLSRRRLTFVLIMTLIMTFPMLIKAQTNFPQPTSLKYVNDYVGVMDDATRGEIVAIGDELEKRQEHKLQQL